MVQRGYSFTGMDLMPGNPFDAICVGPAVGANLPTKIFQSGGERSEVCKRTMSQV